MLPLFGPPGTVLGGEAPIPPIDFSFISHVKSDTNATSYTFNSIAFGAESDSRYIIVGVTTTGGNGHVTAVTVGGIAATQRVHNGNVASTARGSSIWTALVPTGTSGSIVVSTPGVAVNCSMASYRATDILSIIPSDTLSTSNSGVIDIPEGGICIGMMRSHTANDIVWSGLTERGQIITESNMNGTGGNLFAVAQVNLTVSAIAASESAGRFSVASWR